MCGEGIAMARQEQEMEKQADAGGWESLSIQTDAGTPSLARDASERIRARAKKLGLGPFDWEQFKAYRDEGRKF